MGQGELKKHFEVNDEYTTNVNLQNAYKLGNCKD